MAIDLNDVDSAPRMQAEFLAKDTPWIEVSAMGRRVRLTREPEMARELLIGKHKLFPKSYMLNQFIQLGLGRNTITVVGDEWKKRRHAVQPAFTSSSINSYTANFAEAQKCVLSQAGDGELVDFWQGSGDLAAQALSRMLMGASLPEHCQQKLEEILATVNQPDFRGVRFGQYLHAQQPSIEKIVGEVRPTPDKPHSILKNAMDHSDLSDKELAEELRGFIVAGYETTATVGALAWWHLAGLPEVQEQIRAQGKPAEEQLMAYRKHCRVARSVVQETLRLYPPVFVTLREAREPTELGDERFAAGDLVGVSLYSVQRHPAFWPEPEEFRAGRFVDAYPKSAYIPFGVGPRTCLGDRLAVAELTFHIVDWLQHHRVARADDTPPTLECGAPMRIVSQVQCRLEPIPAQQ